MDNLTSTQIELPHDIELPPNVSAWPPAPGWWLLAALLLGLLIAAFWWLRRRYRRNADKRAAQRQLRSLWAAYQSQRDAQRFCSELSLLLKRFAVGRFPREEVAQLSGERWLGFLNRHGGAVFDAGSAALLLAAYRPLAETPPESELAKLREQARQWLRHSR